jgi:hypothetical protein
MSKQEDQDQIKLKSIHTSCKDCIFANYLALTQIGCKANQLDLFKQNGIDIVEAYDDEQEFYIINGKQCLFYRPSEWKGDFDKARKEIKLIYRAIIIAGNTIQPIVTTVKSLENQTQPPTIIDIVRPTDSLASIQNLRQYFSSKCKIYNIVNPKLNTLDDYCRLILTGNKIPYVAVFNAGIDIPNITFQILLDKMINELFEFQLILPNKARDGLIFPFLIWRYFTLTGDKHQDIITEIQNDKECQKIYSINDIIPCFPK